jgi:hypothetical protein
MDTEFLLTFLIYGLFIRIDYSISPDLLQFIERSRRAKKYYHQGLEVIVRTEESVIVHA